MTGESHTDESASHGLTRRMILTMVALASAGITVVGNEGIFVSSASAATPLYWPTSYRGIPVGGEFGNDRGVNHSPRYHEGTDLGVGVGTAVFASGSGVVSFIRNTGTEVGYGLHVAVTYGAVRIIVAHLSAVLVSEGQQVTVSTQLGRSGGAQGSFGAGASTGPHLHVETTISGQLTNPQNFLLDRSYIGSQPPVVDDEDEMKLIRITTAYNQAPVGYTAFIGYKNLRHITQQSVVDALLALGVPLQQLTGPQFHLVLNAYSMSGDVAIPGAQYDGNQ